MDKEQPEGKPEEETTDVAPDWFVRILMIAWLVLLGGRWIATPFIMFGDPSVAEAVSSADRGPLLRCYLVVLLLTLIVPALRFAKWLEQKRTSSTKADVQSSAM